MVKNPSVESFARAFGEQIPPPALSFSIENDIAFAKALDAAIKEVDDLRFAFGEIARDFFKSNQAIFTLKNGGQYPPLSPEYQERKDRVLGRRAPILVFSGRLKNSLTGTPNSDSIVRIGKKSMILGTKVPYGIYHQSDSPRFKMPQRKFLFIGAEAPRTAPSQITGRLERWLRIIDDEVARKLKARSGR
jgi:phage gpG-like protein